jgi:hypothetical protein
MNDKANIHSFKMLNAVVAHKAKYATVEIGTLGLLAQTDRK